MHTLGSEKVALMPFLAALLILFLSLPTESLATQTYDYYPSGRIKNVTYTPPVNGIAWEEYLDEDWLGWGYGRARKRILETADSDGAIAYEYTYSPETVLLGAKLGGASGDDVIVAAGSEGLWEYMDNSTWTQISSGTPETMNKGKLNSNSVDDVIVDFGASGLWKYMDNSAWTRLSASNADNIVVGDFDNNGIDDAIVDFGSTGLWKYSNDSAWSRVSASNADDSVVGDIDNSGQADVIVDFGTLGLYKFLNDTTWYKISDSNTEKITIADMDANGTQDMVVDFGSLGFYKYMNGSEWYKISSSNPENLVIADLDNNGTNDMVVDFGNVGLWKYSNNQSWTKISDTNPEKMVVGDLDNNGTKDIVVDFGSTGLWKFMNNSSWVKISSTNATDVTVADLDGNGVDDLVVDFGASGLYKYTANATWAFLSPLNSDRTDTIKAYRNSDLTDLVYTETRDSSGGVLEKVYDETIESYTSGKMKRKIKASTSEIYEYMDENYNGQGYGRIILISDSGEGVYTTYEWNDTHDPPYVTVIQYSGEYEPASGSGTWSDKSLSERRHAILYYHHGEQLNLDAASNGWTVWGDIVFASDGYTMTQDLWYSYYESGRFKRATENISGYITEYTDESVSDGHGWVALSYNPSQGGKYTTYLWSGAQVTVQQYSGAYSPGSAVWSDVQENELTEEFVYDHKNNQGDLNTATNGWVMREHTLYKFKGGPLWYRYAYNAAGDLVLAEYETNITYEYYDDGLQKRYRDENGTGSVSEYLDENFDPDGEGGAAPLGYGRTILGTDYAHGAYRTWSWDDESGQVRVRDYAGTYEVGELSANLSDVQAEELAQEIVYDHYGEEMNLDADPESQYYNGWLMRENIIYNGPAGPMRYRYLYNEDGQLMRAENADVNECTMYSYFEDTGGQDLVEVFTLDTNWKSSTWYWHYGDSELVLRELKIEPDWGAGGESGSEWRYARHCVLTFDNTSGVVDCGTGSGLNLTGSFTLMASVKTTAANQQALFAKYSNTTYSGYYFIIDTTGKLWLYTRDVNYSANNWASAKSTGTVNDGGWHSVAVVLDGAGLSGTYYIDGAASGTFTIGSRSGDTSDAPFYIGTWGTTSGFDGSMRSASVYDRALSVEEVAERSSGGTGVTDGLVADWAFQEQGGATVADATGQNNGTITGGDGDYNRMWEQYAEEYYKVLTASDHTTVTFYSDAYVGTYVTDTSYTAYYFDAPEEGQVSKVMYDGSYISNLEGSDVLFGGVQEEERRVEYVYEYNGNTGDLDTSTNGWVMRQQIIYDESDGVTEKVKYAWDGYGRFTEEYNIPADTYKYLEYFEVEGDYSTVVSYQEEYKLTGMEPVAAYWFYESGRLWKKWDSDTLGDGIVAEYFDEGQTGSDDYYSKVVWSSDGSVMGWATSGDYTSARPTWWLNADHTQLEYYTWYTTEWCGVQYQNFYEWNSGTETWNWMLAYEFINSDDGNGDRFGQCTGPALQSETGAPDNYAAPPAKPEFQGAASGEGGGPLSLDAPLLVSEDVLLSDDVKAFFEKLDAMKSASSGEGVLVALLDSGVNAEGTDLRIAGGYDFAGTNRNSADRDADYSDMLGHGTETAKVIGAIAGNADILAVKVLDNYSMTDPEIVAEAIRYAADTGAKVLVMPFGLASVNSLVTDALAYAADKGAIIVAAAGNDSMEILDSSLAAQDKLITVGSVDNDGKLSAWSNYGSAVDLYAPWDIITQSTVDGPQSTGKAGTSFSAAFVAGLAALVLEQHPEYTADDVLGELKGLLAGVQPKAEVKTKVDAELASKQAALVKQTEELSGTSPKVDGMVDLITQ